MYLFARVKVGAFLIVYSIPNAGPDRYLFIVMHLSSTQLAHQLMVSSLMFANGLL